MRDITYCDNATCPSRNKCARFLEEPINHVWVQTFIPKPDKCVMFWDVKDFPHKRQLAPAHTDADEGGDVNK